VGAGKEQEALSDVALSLHVVFEESVSF
jgi:hypothetical protein